MYTSEDAEDIEEKLPDTEMKMTTPLFLLRCVQIGISLRDLDLVTIGCINDMFAGKGNNSTEYAEIATQDQMDRF